MDPKGFQKKEFQHAVIAAQIGKVRLHDRRHTFGAVKIETAKMACGSWNRTNAFV